MTRSLLLVVTLGFAACTGQATPSKRAPEGPVEIIEKPPVIGQIDAPETTLPTRVPLTRVVATLREDSVGIDFDPVDDAVDYRVYVLPANEDVEVAGDETVTVKNAVYRCAGLRQAYDLENNQNAGDASLVTDHYPYNWKAEIPAEPTLGHVYVEPGDDRIAVYAVAGDQGMLEGGWRESRSKIYTTDSLTRDALLAEGWRDDGIVFYAVATASDATRTVYGSRTNDRRQFYFHDGELSARAGDQVAPAPAFEVLREPAPGTQPLMAVNYGGAAHVELTVGKERFRRAAFQGNGPLWHLTWSGITEPVTLVIEALDGGCPYQGFLAADHLEAPPHQTFYTLDELRNAKGEVFVNGQHDVTRLPQALARSFIRVEPQPRAEWDWYEGFDTFGPITELARPNPQTCWNCKRWQTERFDISGYTLDDPEGVYVVSFGAIMGQLVSAFDDWAQDTPGKLRFTAREKTVVTSDNYLHVTWSTDIVGTNRRYPQLIVSDRDAPVQEGLSNPDHDSLLIQTIDGPSMNLQVQAIHGLINGKAWDINNQQNDPHVFVGDQYYTGILPVEPVFEHAGIDRMTRFDAFISSNRVYVFLDGTPMGCTEYPSNFELAGDVTVTFGDVLYHEGAPDERVCYQSRPFNFLNRHQCWETKRRFDDIGWKAGVGAPEWDDEKLPCEAY